MVRRALTLGTLVLMVLLTVDSAARAGQPPGIVYRDATFSGIASDQVSVDILLSDGTRQNLLVNDVAVKDYLNGLHHGDHLSVLVVTDGGKSILQNVSARVSHIGPAYRVVVLLAAGFVFWLACFLLSGFHPEKLIMGEDGRFSNSKFQTVLWFGVLVASYLSTIWLRTHIFGGAMLGGVNIPENLLLLSGMSALTFTAAKGITVTKIRNATTAGAANVKPRALAAHFWSDLTSNDNNLFDLGDFQMLVMTFLAVGTFLALIYHFLGSLEARTIVDLPDVDTTILASFGLGHGAYLTKKAVGEVGDT